MNRSVGVLFFVQVLLLSGFGCSLKAQDKREIFRDTSYSLHVRVDDLVSRLSLEEKVAQMQNEAPAITRLGIPAYNW